MNMLNSSLESVEKEKYMRMIGKFPDFFITSHEEIRGLRCEALHIELKEDSRPIFQKLRRIPSEQLPVLKEELNKL